MADPTGYLTAKVASMIGGLFGGFAILTFIRPKTISEAFMRGGVSVGSAMVFTYPLLEMMGLSNNWETQLMGGFCVGFLAYTVLGMVANFLQKNQHKDIVEVVKEVKKND
jgi:hypothetical protein